MERLILAILIFIQQGLYYFYLNNINREVIGYWFNFIQFGLPIINILLIVFAGINIYAFFRSLRK